MNYTTMTFFERFEADILSGKKTLTIRNESEKYYIPESIVQVSTYENNRWFCSLKIKSVESTLFNDLIEVHAQQENMSLLELKRVIQEIYPGIKELYVIYYQLIKE